MDTSKELPRHESIEFDIQYDSELREKVAKGQTNPVGWIRIRVDSTPFNGENGMNEYLGHFVGGMLQTVDAVVDDEREFFILMTGPAYYGLDPFDEDHVVLFECYSRETARNPEMREDYENEVVVPKRTFIRELVRIGKQFVEWMVDANPELKEDSGLVGLEEDLAHARKRYEEAFGSLE